MHIHYFQHIPYENLAVIEDWINQKGHKLTCTRFYEKVWFPPVNQIDWLIIMGGYMGVYDEHEFPWLIQEKQYIREAIKKNKIVLGICLGSQLIASALSARVYKNDNKEIGWHKVKLTEQAKENVITDFMPKEFVFFQWHGDTFDLPENAVRIAESEGCKNQGFIFKEKVIGLQFHPEVTEKSVKDLINNCGEELVDEKYIQSEEEILSGIHLASDNNKIMLGILERMEKLNLKTVD